MHEFDIVSVSLPEAGPLHNSAFDSHVLAVAGTTVALEPTSRASATWIPKHVDNVFLSFRHDGTLIALKGSLSTRDSVGDLRFKVTDPPRPERRNASRINACLPVSLEWADSGERSEGLTIDLSANGLLVGCTDQPEIGSLADVTLSLPGRDEPVVSGATVVRVEDGRVALKLASDTPGARSRIAGFVLERNRMRLRMRQQIANADDLDF